MFSLETRSPAPRSSFFFFLVTGAMVERGGGQQQQQQQQQQHTRAAVGRRRRTADVTSDQRSWPVENKIRAPPADRQRATRLQSLLDAPP